MVISSKCGEPQQTYAPYIIHQPEDAEWMGGALTERLHLPVSMLVIIEQLFERRVWISLGPLRMTAWESMKS